MTFIEILLIGVALAMDAFALTIANCSVYKKSLNKLKEWSMPVAFGFFQFLMPVIGFYIGSIFSSILVNVASIITAIIFFILGCKIIIDKIKESKHIEEKNSPSEFSFLILIVQAIATSIDALAIGVTFAIKLPSPFIPSIIIFAVTFIIVSIGLFIGKSLGKLVSKYTSIIGAVILFSLSIKNIISAIVG